jgi:molecular chaperone GrpE
LFSVAQDKNQPEASEAPEATEPAQQELAEPSDENAGSPDSRVEALEREVETLRDQALRAQAEVENVRRRSARDVENAHKFALERFTADLLPVIDSLERAAQGASELKNGEDERLSGLTEGVELSMKLLHDSLARVGVVQEDPEAAPFDPGLHEAVSVIENDDVEPGTVLHVLQKGYTLNGRVVRAATVIVAKAKSTKADEV